MERVIANLNYTNVHFDTRTRTFTIDGDVAHQAEDLRLPKFDALQPHSAGFAILAQGETVTLQVDDQTQVTLSTAQNGEISYSVGGQAITLRRPMILGKTPNFQLDTQAKTYTSLPSARDTNSLLLSPAYSEGHVRGFFVLNFTDHDMQITSSARQQLAALEKRQVIPVEDLPTRRIEVGRKHPPVIAGAAVEAMKPLDPIIKRASEDVKLIKGNTFYLADGMGGQGHGKEAAELAIKTLSDYEDQSIPANATTQQVESGFRQGLFYAHAALRQMKPVLVNGELRKPGSTVVLGRIVYGEGPYGRKAVIAWSGDSRAYLQYPNGDIKPLTVDDNLQQDYAKTQKPFVIMQATYGPVPVDLDQLDPTSKEYNTLQHIILNENDANEIDGILNNVTGTSEIIQKYREPLRTRLRAFFNARNRVRSGLGGVFETIEPHVITVDVQPGSRIWYTSDGTHDVLPEPLLFDAFRKASQVNNHNPDAQAWSVLTAVDDNNNPSNGRNKNDDHTVGYQYIPLAT